MHLDDAAGRVADLSGVEGPHPDGHFDGCACHPGSLWAAAGGGQFTCRKRRGRRGLELLPPSSPGLRTRTGHSGSAPGKGGDWLPPSHFVPIGTFLAPGPPVPTLTLRPGGCPQPTRFRGTNAARRTACQDRAGPFPGTGWTSHPPPLHTHPSSGSATTPPLPIWVTEQKPPGAVSVWACVCVRVCVRAPGSSWPWQRYGG